MRILFDHGVPRGLAALLSTQEVKTARSMGWDQFSNGDLLKAGEQAGFDLLLTTDRRIQYQQNIKDRKISILVLAGSTKWSRVKLHGEQILAIIHELTPGGYAEVHISFGPR